MNRGAVIVIGSNSTRYVSANLDEFSTAPLRRRIETRLFLCMENGLLAQRAVQETADGICRLASLQLSSPGRKRIPSLPSISVCRFNF